jgi:hypothetical protein
MAEANRIAGLDTSVAHPARVYDYWLGGKDNFAADREAAGRVLAAAPGLRYRVRANRAFLGRATRYLAAEAALRQFATPQTLRTREQVARFFAGLELVDPGLVQVHQWRPGHRPAAGPGSGQAAGARAAAAGLAPSPASPTAARDGRHASFKASACTVALPLATPPARHPHTHPGGQNRKP